ncbi:MAG: sigma-70 family RNA polymerase sigma factor [Fluviicola sp.]|nr:sigma-70 family RNA polymerase sigma factor [Fluviicola sp.]
MKKLNYSEEELVLLLQQKDLKAFSYLYDNYAPGLLGVIMRLLRNQAVSEDVLQTVFVKIWKGMEGYDASRGRLYTWMINISINSAIDYSKSKQAKKETNTSGIESNFGVVDRTNFTTFNTDVIGLKDQVDTLKDEYKILIEYIYYQGLTHDEAAKELDLPLGTVKTRVRSAVAQLRELMK